MLENATVSLRAIAPTLALVTLTAIACGGTTGGGGSVTADQAATDAANAYCNRAQACAPTYVTAGFGDVATCASRLKSTLLPAFGATGTSSTPDQTEACAQAIPQATCSDLLSRRMPDACKTLPGKLADGAACAFDGQCQGTRCKVAANAACGTCTEPAAAGAACGVDSDCQQGMLCVSGACATYGDENALCDASHPCRPDLGCKSGSCTAPSPVGTACQASAECDELHGVFCNPMTMKCDNVSFAAANATCGFVNNGFVLCSGPGSLCNGAAPPTYQGTCVPYATDGTACDTTKGPLCDVGAVCANGTCQIPDGSTCH
jgi:hypothetical protein